MLNFTGIDTQAYSTKLCNRCQDTKSLSEFHKNRRRPDGYHNYCKDCRSDIRKSEPEKYREGNRKRNRTWRLKRVYNMTEEDYLRLLNLHEHRCHICNQRFSADLSDHIDHDHASHRVRGILCGSCNRALGLFKDNPTLLRQAADYLEKHQ